jgi:hypothetical protein
LSNSFSVDYEGRSAFGDARNKEVRTGVIKCFLTVWLGYILFF